MTKYKGTMSLLGISILLQIIIGLWPEAADWLAFDPHSFLFPVRILTGMMAHGSWQHLMGNYLFGLPAMMWLESHLGRTKMLELWLLTGLSGSMLNLIVGYDGPAIGSSGAICGMVAAACCLFGTHKVEHLMALMVCTCILVPQILMSPLEMFTGIGYFAHIGGMLAGMLLTHRLYRLPEPVHRCKHPKKR